MSDATQSIITQGTGSSVAITEKNVAIYMPSIPEHVRITDTQTAEFAHDPCLAARVLLGERLDEFQKARLKICWWTPRVMDSSGFSSAKTKNLWILSVLRCMLIEDHIAGVYYQVFSTGQQTYWKYFAEVAMRSKIFRYHLGNLEVALGNKNDRAQSKGPSCWTCTFKNGSQIMMPAAGFLQDAKTQAGIRLNDLYIDEWTKIEATGSEGIDDQLIGRVTRHSFNQHHPFWCNHHLFLATAEDTMHPAYDRYLTYLREVERGNPDYALLSYSFKDYSDRMFDGRRTFKEVFRENRALKDMKINRTTAGYLQEGLGIWSKNGKGWYTKDIIDECYRVGRDRGTKPLVRFSEDPMFGKPNQEWVRYFMGVDPSRGETKKADDGALVVLRAVPTNGAPTSDPNNWDLDFVWAYKVRKASPTQWSGLIHRKHLEFMFALIEMDSQGGGNWIRPELAKAVQKIQNRDMNVQPIGCVEDESYMSITSSFILSMFRIVDPKISNLWGHMAMRHPDNLYDTAHSEFLESLSKGRIAFPERYRKLAPEVKEGWSEERVHANLMLDLTSSQLLRISVQTNNDGTTYFSKNGARSFSAKGKKDFAYAAMFAHTAFLAWVKNFEDDGYRLAEEDAAQGSGRPSLSPGSYGGRMSLGMGNHLA